MIEVAAVVALAALGGIGMLANTYPKGYATLGKIVLYGSAMATVFMATFIWGITTGVDMVRESSPMLVDGRYTFYGVNPWVPVLKTAGLTGYFAFLGYLPKIHQADKKPEDGEAR